MDEEGWIQENTMEERTTEQEVTTERGSFILAEPAQYRIIKFIVKDDADSKILGLPEDFLNTIYDKELVLSNITDGEMKWVMMQYSRVANYYKMGRPVTRYNHREEMKLTIVPAKLLVKLARSRNGFERRQQNTQYSQQRVERVTTRPAPRRGFWIFGGREESEE